MATLAEVKNLAVTRLGILGEGETLPSYESADMSLAYAEVHAQLTIKDIATWDTDEDIPDEYAGYVADLMAGARLDDYGVPNDRYQRLMAAKSRAIPEILELQTNNSYETPEADYF
jgi:hypothetical protein